MLETRDILETINMIDNENLDVRTITMGISLLDCIDPDIDMACVKVYDKITSKAEKLVATGEKIEKFVHNLIEERISDGQLDDSGLTLKEIRKVEKSLISGLSSTFHSRIKYPKMKSEAETMKVEKENG